MARNTHPVGMKVRVNMGLDRDKFATIVKMGKIPKDGQGIPKLGKGHYKRAQKDDRAIQYEDGTLDVQNKGNLIPVLHIFTLIPPDGDKEIILGAFANESQARGFAKRKYAADWLSLAAYPFQKRELNVGEKVQWGDPWTE